MIEWEDEGFCLALRLHGESSAILECHTRGHGRVAAYVHGGASRKRLPDLQVGNHMHLRWRARLGDQLGAFQTELARPRAALVMADAAALAGMAAVAALVRKVTPERQPAPELHDASVLVLDAIADPAPDARAVWPLIYVRWELGLLAALGYGLDLTECALTGATDTLGWVSPRTGRAATLEAGAPFSDRLLRLPSFLVDAQAEEAPNDLADGFALTGFFLEHRVFDAMGEGVPDARRRLIETLGRQGRL
jgi:DNA repair protein RecO (recombination protein O)